MGDGGLLLSLELVFDGWFERSGGAEHLCNSRRFRNGIERKYLRPIFSLVFTWGLTLLVDLYAVPGCFGDEQAALWVYVD